LFTTFDYHAFVTDRPGDRLEIEADHRRHAIVEQSIAELKSAGLAHLPSSKFMANAAWLALAVIAHNLAHAVGLLTGDSLHRATVATLRRAIFTMPGRLVRRAVDNACDYPRTGPGPRHSPPPWPRSPRSRCAAEPDHHRPPQPRTSDKPANRHPDTAQHQPPPHEDQLSSLIDQLTVPRWIRAKSGGGNAGFEVRWAGRHPGTHVSASAGSAACRGCRQGALARASGRRDRSVGSEVCR
jgi:hypothetical protein